MRNITHIIIHCSDSVFGDAELIDSWHKENGWSSIGYHFVILNGFPKNSKDYHNYYDGFIEYGRDICLKGAHAKGWNSNSIGICLIGISKFTENQMDTLIYKIKNLQAKYKIPKKNVIGHYEVDDSKTCPNLDMNKIRAQL